MGKIFLNGLRAQANIGITEEEKKEKQTLIIDIEIRTSLNIPASTDDINQTIDYCKVHDLVVSMVENSDCFLLETLANNIAEKLLDYFNPESVKIKIKKPMAAYRYNGDEIGVELVRTND